MHLNGVRITPLPLVERKALLADLVAMVGDKHLQFSGDFDDPTAVLHTCQRMYLVFRSGGNRPTGPDLHATG